MTFFRNVFTPKQEILFWIIFVSFMISTTYTFFYTSNPKNNTVESLIISVVLLITDFTLAFLILKILEVDKIENNDD